MPPLTSVGYRRISDDHSQEAELLQATSVITPEQFSNILAQLPQEALPLRGAVHPTASPLASPNELGKAAMTEQQLTSPPATSTELGNATATEQQPASQASSNEVGKAAATEPHKMESPPVAPTSTVGIPSTGLSVPSSVASPPTPLSTTAPLPSPPPSVAPATTSVAYATHAYYPTAPGHVPLLPNDKVIIREYLSEEWGKGLNERNGIEGLFPRNHVGPFGGQTVLPMMPPQQFTPAPPMPGYNNMAMPMTMGYVAPTQTSAKPPGKPKTSGLALANFGLAALNTASKF